MTTHTCDRCRESVAVSGAVSGEPEGWDIGQTANDMTLCPDCVEDAAVEADGDLDQPEVPTAPVERPPATPWRQPTGPYFGRHDDSASQVAALRRP